MLARVAYIAYRRLAAPVLDRLDSEQWHEHARHALSLAERRESLLRLAERSVSPGQVRRPTTSRASRVGRLRQPRPRRRGVDKSGVAVRGLHALGFAGVEVGTVTPRPQPGNNRPRQWMIACGVAINRLGFNSPGAHAVAANLERYRGWAVPIGVSLGKNRDTPPELAAEDHALVAARLYPYAAYFAVNVSSPNTPGLRALQDKGPLTEIVRTVNSTMDGLGGRKPIFVKVAPELSAGALLDVIEVVLDNSLTGIVAVNSTNDPGVKGRYGERWGREAGGLSGDDPVYRAMATETVRRAYAETGGRIQIVGVGGVKDAATALEKIQAGASAVQVVTAIRSEGPSVADRINRGQIEWMEREGVRRLAEAVGTLALAGAR
ncbi:MAG: quinone-dependent dihydroorotate dehydrogenase [Chloroflexia bacterium]